MFFHEAAGRALIEGGFPTMFGVVGDGNLFLVNSYRQAGGHYVAATHEAGAVMMACGYNAISGKPGLATTTHGPGLTNALTALTEAARSRRHVLVVVADTPSARLTHPQDISHADVVAPSGAGFVQVRSEELFAEDLARAIREMTFDSRPVVLNVPAEFNWRETDYRFLDPSVISLQPIAPDPNQLDTAVGVIASAQRPVVLAGTGATSEPARSRVIEFSKRIGAPLSTTLLARNAFDDQPHNIGIFGNLSSDDATKLIAGADCIVVFGASLNVNTTASGSLTEQARIVQVDNDRRAFGRFLPVDAPVLGDAALAAEAFISWLDEAEIPPTRFLAQVPEGPGSPAANGAQASEDGALSAESALKVINQVVAADRNLVLDAGQFLADTWLNVDVVRPGAYVHTVGFGSIGMGMGHAVGAAVGAPEFPTLHITGDGGFMMGGLVEFNTAVREELDIVVVVLNDGAYGAEHVQLRDRGIDPGLTLFDWPDLTAVAEALGGHGLCVRRPADLQLVKSAVENRRGPLLIDVHLDPNAMRRLPAH